MTKYLLIALLVVACVVQVNNSQAETVVSKDGTNIHYEIRGQGPVVLLLHGLGSSGSSWEKTGFVDQLQDYRLILVDARGHGDSEGPGHPGGFAMKKFVEDLEAILQEESDSPPIFWGFSMGAAIGFHVMQHNPTLFSRYILGDGMIGIYGSSPEQRSAELGSVNVLRIQASRAFEGSKKLPTTMADFLEFDRTDELESIRDNFGFIAAPTFIYRSGDTQAVVKEAQERTGFNIPIHFSDLKTHMFPQLTHGDLMGRSELVVPEVLEFLTTTQD